MNENDNNIQKYTPPSLQKVAKQMAVVAKLIGNTEEEERLIALCVRHPRFFIEMVSMYYPFSYPYPSGNILVEKYRDLWDWKGLGQNKYLNDWRHLINPWDFADFFDKYKDRWDWESLSRINSFGWNCNYNDGEWFFDLIDEYSDRWNWESLSCNHLEWSIDLIDKYILRTTEN